MARYAKAAKRISRLVKRQPFSPDERLVKWTEFAIENGGLPELLTQGRYLSVIVHNNLDIWIPFAVLLLSSLVAVALVVIRVVRVLNRIVSSTGKLKKN